MLLKNKISIVFQMVIGLILLGGISWFYWPVLEIMVNVLISTEDYSFGILLPFVSGYVIYLKWPQICRDAWQPSWLGLGVIFFGLILYIFGELVAIFYLPQISFLVVLSGLAFLLGGRSMVRLLAFPLFLLYLMIPLPALIIKHLTIPLQLISSRLASEFLQIIGIPVVLQGNIIDMGVRQLQVVEACSGLRYILSLTALGFIFCYFYQRRIWKAFILIVSIIPLAIFANAFRLAAMGIFPVIQQKGFWHDFSGWLIFIVCFAFLGLCNWILNYLWPQRSSPESGQTQTYTGGSPSGNPRVTHLPHLLAALVLLIIAGALIPNLSNAPPMPLRQSFDNFPLELGPWKGRLSSIDPNVIDIVKCDAYLDMTFTNLEQEPVSLWIAYFASQKKGNVEGGHAHSPLHCMLGGGWKIVEYNTVDVAPGHPVWYMLLEQGGSRIVVYYWYFERGRWVASDYFHRFFMGFDGLLRRRNDGALIRIITPVRNNIEVGQERLKSFARLLIPVLPQFIAE